MGMAETSLDRTCSSEHSTMPSSHISIQLMLGLYACFTIEIVLRFVGKGPRGFWESWYNRFDVLVWVVALVGMAVGCTELKHDNPKTTIHTHEVDDCLVMWGCQWKWLGLLILRCFCLLRLSLWETEYTVLWYL